MNTINTDSLVITTLSDINVNLSAINENLLASDHNSFLGVSWDILLPTIISIAIFILGYYITGLQARRKIQKSRNLVRDTIVTWADSNFETLNKYVESIKDLAERIGNSDTISPVSFSIQHLTINVLTQFSIDRLTDALVSGLPNRIDKAEKGAQLNAYLTSVSYLDRGQNIVMQQYEEYHSTATDVLNRWEKKWAEFMVNCDMNRLRVLNMPMTPENDFYSNLAPSSIVTDKDFFKCSTGEKLIKTLSRVILNPPVYTKEIIDTMYIFRELKSIMDQIEDIKKMYNQLFLIDVAKIEKGYERFRSAIDFYRRQKMKRFA